MRRPALAVRAVSFALLLAAPALAQSVWIVDDGGGAGVDFTDMPAAIAAAGEGDLILVRDGFYSEFTISAKSLTVLADAGHHPLVSEPLGTIGTGNAVIRVINLAAGQEVTLRGLEIGGTAVQSVLNTPYVFLAGNAGEVWIEDVELTDGVNLHMAAIGIQATDCAAVTISRSTLTAMSTNGGFGHAVVADDTNLTLWDCSAVGATGGHGVFTNPAQPGGHGVAISGGSLFAAGCTISGGDGGEWSTGPTGGAGGDGLHVNGGALVRLRDCALAGGAGGQGTTSSGPAGQMSNVVNGSMVPIPGTGRTLELSSPARAGVDPVTETYAGEPGDLVYLLWSYTGQMPPFFLGIEHGSFVIDVSTLDGVAVGTVGAGGTLVVTVPPLSLVGLEAFSFACQASFFQAGGGFFLSSPSLFTLLGPGF